MTCLEYYLQEHPTTDVDELIEQRCPNISGGIDIPDPPYCDSKTVQNCVQCWNRQLPCTDPPPAIDEEPRIYDSGERREFSTGAVRDIQEGKGRCDLMPLEVASHFLYDDQILGLISDFQETNDTGRLYEALKWFCGQLLVGHGTEARASLLLEVAKHFEDGAKKYGEHNWQKGIPVRCYIDSAVRHYLKWLRGDKDEPHDRAFCWNIMCAIWTCKHKPELNDYNKEETEE